MTFLIDLKYFFLSAVILTLLQNRHGKFLQFFFHRAYVMEIDHAPIFRRNWFRLGQVKLGLLGQVIFYCELCHTAKNPGVAIDIFYRIALLFFGCGLGLPTASIQLKNICPILQQSSLSQGSLELTQLNEIFCVPCITDLQDHFFSNF